MTARRSVNPAHGMNELGNRLAHLNDGPFDGQEMLTYGPVIVVRQPALGYYQAQTTEMGYVPHDLCSYEFDWHPQS